jgi:predicted DNA-binding transcriptional regulator AlpA
MDTNNPKVGRSYSRKPAVVKRLGISIPTLDRWVATGLMPRPYRIGPNIVAFANDELDLFVANRPQVQS